MNLTPAKTEFTTEEHVALRQDVRIAMTEDKISQADLSRATEIPAPTLSQYLSASYKGDLNAIATVLHKWLEARKRSAALRLKLPIPPSFQPLPTSSKILDLLEMARVMGRLVTITGEPGTSKSASARQYCNLDARRWMATMDPSTSGVPTMLSEVLTAMGDADTKGTPQVLARRVVNNAVHAPNALLVIDEYQHLSDKAIEQIRAINDVTRARGVPLGIALVGNDSLGSKIAGNGTKSSFAQVSSRIAQRRSLARPDPADVAQLAQAWAEANDAILTKVELSFLQKIAARPGGLRNVEMTFEGALLVSISEGENLTIDHLQGAFQQLSGLTLAA